MACPKQLKYIIFQAESEKRFKIPVRGSPGYNWKVLPWLRDEIDKMGKNPERHVYGQHFGQTIATPKF